MSAPVAVLDRPVATVTARSHADDAAITVEWTRHLTLAGEDAVTLDRILAARPEVAVFMSPAWLAGFLEDPVEGEPGFAILRQGSTIRGIAPIAVRRTRTQTRVSLLGGSFGSDRVDLVTARGFEGAGSDAFLQWLQATFGERGFVLELRDVPAASPLWGAISRATAEHRPGGAVQPREVNVCRTWIFTSAFPRRSGTLRRRRRACARSRSTGGCSSAAGHCESNGSIGRIRRSRRSTASSASCTRAGTAPRKAPRSTIHAPAAFTSGPCRGCSRPAPSA